MKKKKGGGVKKYDLAICAVFKNEAAYLQEWIEYHRLVGVAHFYLYNNNSNDEYLIVLKKYILDEIVTLKDVPGEVAQGDVYRQCILENQQDVKWIAIIDLDEFICLKYELSGALKFNKSKNCNEAISGPLLNEWLAKFKYFPALKFWWKRFGSSGLIKRDSKRLVIEDFIFCERDNINHNSCKPFLNLDYYDKFNFTDIHQPTILIWLGLFSIKILPFNVFGFFDYLAKRFRPVQINHYITKSYNEFYKRKLIQLTLKYSNNANLQMSTEEAENSMNWIDINSTERDYSIMRFLPKLKKIINDTAQ